jgi:GT2 family glycosyltransferase
VAAGKPDEAVRWLDRALRLTPRDQNIALSLATLLLGRDNVRAASLFDAISHATDLREAWQGLAAARLLLGDPVAASTCLARALMNSVVADAVAPLAGEIAARAGRAGWCGVTAAGQLLLHPLRPGAAIVMLDGRRTTLRGTALPQSWRKAQRLDVVIGDEALLGSPIDLGRLRRVVGFVEADAGGLRGWAWQPGSPDADPTLIVQAGSGAPSWRLRATDEAMEVPHAGALARPRGFRIAADRLTSQPGLWHVLSEDGRDLLGSPLDPTQTERAGRAGAEMLSALYPAGVRASGSSRRRVPVRPGTVAPAALPIARRVPRTGKVPGRRKVSVVIPVFNDKETTRACLESLWTGLPRGCSIVVVDDASDEAALTEWLDDLARRRRIRLIRQPSNQGFARSANAGFADCAGQDIVLLNSDTIVPADWLERLRDAAYSAVDIGTATPFSNDASILSYPNVESDNPVPDLAATERLAKAAWRANRGGVVDIPVGVGFCLYIRHDCLAAVGSFRADVFAQGYGEENDFCLRARHLGWRHVAVPGAFVAHRGSASFGGAGRHLRERNERILRELHPGYEALVGEFIRTDPLGDVRRRLDVVRLRATWTSGQDAVLLITHDDGGGVEHCVKRSCEIHLAAQRYPLVLRPAVTKDGEPACTLSHGDRGAGGIFPNLRYRLPQELPVLVRLLRAAGVQSVEVHHLLNHDPSIYELIAQLSVPYDVYVHDYALFCPRIALVGGSRRYCGEPGPAECEACVADNGRYTQEDIAVPELLDRSERFLGRSRRVIAPSIDTADRMHRHFSSSKPLVEPIEDDDAIEEPPPPAARDGKSRVCVLGAIGEHKGYDVLLGCARDAVARDLPLDFVVVGSTIDDSRLLATGRVFITGLYRSEEVEALIRAQKASLGFLPSIWPETWSLALTELWRAGLRVATFDFGAPAERIRRTGRGFILANELRSGDINNLLVAAVGLSHN